MHSRTILENSNLSPNFSITLTNVTENETFCYSLPIVKGYISSNDGNCDILEENTIFLKKLDNNNATDEITSWPVVHGNFKCLANLDVGHNEFVLQFGHSQLNLNLKFQRKKTDYHVLPVYIICKGDDGRFQAPEHEDNSPESACRRISLGARLIQSFTAEKLFENKMEKKTFQLAGDMNYGFDCIVFHSRLTPEEVYDMESEEIWEHFGRELMSSSYGSERRKFLAFLSCTKYTPNDKEPETYEDVVAQMQGHIALGGGGLAIFGTGCLHTWPETIDQILPRFLDETKVDKTKFMDDSCYRGTYGSCYSTTLGSVCHELGHAFDLGHSKTGIMGRGFDNISLVFTVGNMSRDKNKNLIARNETQHATVCFTRNLNITYSMSSPIKRPRGGNIRNRNSSPRKINSNESNKKCNQKNLSEETLLDNEKKKVLASKILTDDLTFWDKSCSVLLKYHCWFADKYVSNNLMSSIEFDQSRNIISSPAGVRVIELRGDDGLVLASWEFSNTYLPKQFTIPLQSLKTKCIKMVVAENSLGAILKEPIDFNNLHWNSAASGSSIENEEWLAFLQKNMEELMSGQLDCLRNTNLVSVVIAPLRNLNASSKVLEFVANMLALPFVINVFSEKDIENIEEVYLEAKVIPNLIYASKILARNKNCDSRSTSPSASINSDVLVQTVSDLSADELQALESIFLLICYLVHCNEDFLIQFCDAVAILNAFPFLQQFLLLGGRKLRVVTDLLAIFNLILQKSPENANLIEQIVFGTSNEDEKAVDLSKLLMHPSQVVRFRTCELIKQLASSKQCSIQTGLYSKLEQNLHLMLSDSSSSLRMAAEEILEDMKRITINKTD